MSKRSKKPKQPEVRTRNTVALNPLLRKSAVHEKSTKAVRTASKVNLKKTWFERAAAIAAAGQNHVLTSAVRLSPLLRVH